MHDFLFGPFLGHPVWMWLAFIGLVLLLLAFDLGVLHTENRELGVAESLRLSVFYILIAVAFGGFIWYWFDTRPDGSSPVLDYFTGYFLEKSLSIDNVFVIALIFGYFRIPPALQYRALVLGIVAAIVLRGIMIAAGASLVQNYGWVLFLFAAFLIVTGLRMMFMPEKDPELGENALIRFLRRHIRVTERLEGDHFFVRHEGLIYATPLFLALVVINVADIVFAVDSVPAILAVTTDTFIVYTANIMAILGLRALYFALSAMVHRFHYLKYAMAAVLIFIGGKIFWSHFIGHVHPGLSLAITLLLLGGGIVVSLWATRGAKADGHGS